jgi:hypothetical protein
MTDPLARLVLLAHSAATLYMAGVIWFVQLVHYPLLARIGSADVPGYQREHTARTFWAVAPPMLVEASTAVLLVWVAPPGVAGWQVWTGGALLVAVWGSTWLVQIPCHDRLCRAFDPAVHRRLVASNWVRTAAWSLRGGLVLWMLWNVTSGVRG